MSRQFLIDKVNPDEAIRLLLGILMHDIGMLSQNAADMPNEPGPLYSKSNATDVASWVRQTHVYRIEKLVKRLLANSEACDFLNTDAFAESVAIAKAHQAWPWEWNDALLGLGRNRGLAAVLAVADLLDEDAARCDTITLLDHREGNELNRAHWLRHALTSDRILVASGSIDVRIIRPPDTGVGLRAVFSAMRNHFRLVSLYEADLDLLGAAITNISLAPCTGIPPNCADTFPDWKRYPGFPNENALALQLLKTFMPAALMDENRCDARMRKELLKASLEQVDTSVLAASRGIADPRSDIEETFAAIIGSK